MLSSLGFPSGSAVKNLLVMQEMQKAWVQSLGWEDSLEMEMATHCSILAWTIPWTEGPGGLQSMGSQTARHDLGTEYTCTISLFVYKLISMQTISVCVYKLTNLIYFIYTKIYKILYILYKSYIF